MSLIVVAADPDSYLTAAGHLGRTGTPAAGGALPSLGHAGADAALAHFADAIGRYHADLCTAAGDGAGSLRRLAAGFQQADR